MTGTSEAPTLAAALSPPDPPATRRRRGRVLRFLRLLLVAGALLSVAFVAFNWFFVWHSAGDAPAHADVVVVIGGDSPQSRLDEGRALVRAGYAPVMYTDIPDADQPLHCKLVAEGVPTVCFRPAPYTTRGEARWVADQARLHGWHSVLLVTSSYQASRARVRFGRCYVGDLTVVTIPTSGRRIFETLYQDAAFFKAEVTQRGC